MKKIILFENRPERQRLYLKHSENGQNDLDTFQCLTKYTDQHDELISKNDFEFLVDFDLIIFHRSYLVEFKNGSKLTPIYNFCKENSKDLVMFTGGVNGSTYFQENNFKFQSLTISAKEFYLNILDFLNEYVVSETFKCLLELKYGSKWKIEYLLQLRELLTIKIYDSGNELNSDGQIENLIKILGFNNQVSIEDIHNQLNADIKTILHDS